MIPRRFALHGLSEPANDAEVELPRRPGRRRCWRCRQELRISCSANSPRNRSDSGRSRGTPRGRARRRRRPGPVPPRCLALARPCVVRMQSSSSLCGGWRTRQETAMRFVWPGSAVPRRCGPSSPVSHTRAVHDAPSCRSHRLAEALNLWGWSRRALSQLAALMKVGGITSVPVWNCLEVAIAREQAQRPGPAVDRS